MLRTPTGEVVLTDYGVGRISRGSVDSAKYYGNGRGNFITLAPEILLGKHANTFASDVCV